MEKVNLDDLGGKKETNVVTDGFDVEKVILASRIKSTDKIDKANYILKINNTNKFSKGNISAWIGKAKSKKTFALSMFIAAIIEGLRLFGVFNANVKGKVIVFDTEQSPYDVQVVVKRIKHLANGSEDNLIMFGLRPYTPEQRIIIIEKVLELHGKEAVAVVIDGIRDLIYNINDAVESTIVMSKIMKWSYDYDVHIACVLHQNKGDGNARGHIGAELSNKAETVIKIMKDEKDPSISYMEESFGRGKGFETFAFQVDNNGMPEVVDVDEATGMPTGDDLPF